MTDEQLQLLRYPTGKFKAPEIITSDHIKKWTGILEALPNRFSDLVAGLTDIQLETPYRPNGWTVRQVIHHVSDSHHHSYIRFKWTLTEDKPIIKAYYEDRWAELTDAKEFSIQPSLDHLKAVHAKLVLLIRSLSDEQLKRSYFHPETNKEISLNEQVGIYAWHGQHHFAHIENLIKREGWK